MSDIKQSIVESLDGKDIALLSYLPYILQDLRELGADPDTVLDLVIEYVNKPALRVLDLGCGKGAVSVHIAKNLDCEVYGVDYMEAFIDDARAFARAQVVEQKCHFVCGDANALIDQYRDIDMVVLGAVGPILGDLKESLERIKPLLNRPGFVVLDDAFLPDDSKSTYKRCLRNSEFFLQIKDAGFVVAEERLFSRDNFADADQDMLNLMGIRVKELIVKEPGQKVLLEGYLKSQEYEYQMLATDLITGTWLLKI